MHCSRLFQRSVCACCFLLSYNSAFVQAQQQASKNSTFPFPEKLTYRVEWRLITAGLATIKLSHDTPDDWEFNLNVESSGLVTRLYRVLDTYRVVGNQKFCAATSMLDAQEGKRHTVTRMTFENTRHKVTYDEHDLLKNLNVKRELDIAPCTYEIAGALAALRTMNIDVGKSATFPITDGKKMVNAKIEAQGKETISIEGKTYPSTRFEAFVFDNVLYRRKGRLFIWVTDDPNHLPVQFRLQLGFPIGTITLELEKQEKL
ncbi:MAG: DUF3108 domain-containing protein [Acidobacteriaceae bacterium]|nr:DUF3108 domain-containing protein [Acidobacteriaceae bacterium]